MRVLVAPDKFRGTLAAPEAARAIAAGWRRARPEDEVDELPMADGGEGTLEAVVGALGGTTRSIRVAGPLGDPVDAAYGVVELGGRRTAIVEMARASGLSLLGASRRDPLRTSTRGTGELILAACHDGVDQVLVCLGGSATNDAGAGLAQALGIRLVDARGADLRAGGKALLELAGIDLAGLARSVRTVRFVAACDVDSPLVGPLGASAVYGPQKGASPEDVVVLDRALGHFAAVVHRDLGIDVRASSGGGAAGGLGAGLVAFLGASLRPGAEVVMDAVGFHERLSRADLAVTGEGRFDEQSLRGKVVGAVLGAAGAGRVQALVVCGEAGVAPAGLPVHSLVGRFGRDRALDAAGAALEEMAAEVAARVEEGDRPISSGR